MAYEEFQATFIKENKKLRLILCVSIILFASIILLMIFEKRYFVYQGSAIFEERVLAEKVCLDGFKSISSGDSDSSLVSNGILNIIKKEPFLLAIDKVLVLKSQEKNFCKLVIESKKELLAFKIGLDESESNPFYYKVLSIDEIKPKEM